MIGKKIIIVKKRRNKSFDLMACVYLIYGVIWFFYCNGKKIIVCIIFIDFFLFDIMILKLG